MVSRNTIGACRRSGSTSNLLDDTDPFEIDDQAAHLFKHAPLSIDDIYDVWASDPPFYPAVPPAHWLMVAEVARHVLVVPLAPPDSSNRPVLERPMSPRKKMTRQEEHDFYAKPENQAPQGPARRRKQRLTEMVPVRFPADVLDEIRRRADADDRSVSSWIRRAVEHELHREAG